MAKKTKAENTNNGTESLSEFQDTDLTGRADSETHEESNEEDFDKRPYIIKNATIKDGICNYSFDVVRGVGLGDVAAIKGTHIVEDSMRNAFVKFNVHLAVIDDVFKNKEIEIRKIDKFHNHELTGLYHVSGFQIFGEDDNESIVLIGNKYVSTGGRIEIKTPKIALDNLSSYKWHKELKAAADDAREEVALYKEGHYQVAEVEEESNAKQLTIGNLTPTDELEGEKELDPDFAEAAR